MEVGWEPDTPTQFSTAELLSAAPLLCTQNSMCQTHFQFPVTAAMPKFSHVHIGHIDVVTLHGPGLSNQVKTVVGN